MGLQDCWQSPALPRTYGRGSCSHPKRHEAGRAQHFQICQPLAQEDQVREFQLSDRRRHDLTVLM